MTNKNSGISNVGQRLRMYRKHAGVSQFQLAELASSTARHISFVETGRSRPGKGLILRLAEALELDWQQTNDMLIEAGFRAQGLEDTRDPDSSLPFEKQAREMIDAHSPYPASVVNNFAEIKMTNQAYRHLLPGTYGLTPIESIDALFAKDSFARKNCVNADEVLWYLHDRRMHDTTRWKSTLLEKILDRAAFHLRDLPRPMIDGVPKELSFAPVFERDNHKISLTVTVSRLEGIRPEMLSDLRVQLFFPTDDESRDYFHSLATNMKQD